MKKLQKISRVLAAGLLLSGLTACLFAQEQEDKNKRDRMATETTMTGCLNKDSSGTFTLTDENTGVKTALSGSADMEKHSTHKVTLTGAAKPDAAGKSVFEVTKIEHVSPTCKAPAH